MCLFGFLKHWIGFISRRNDPKSLELCIGCRLFVYLSNKTNFTKNKFMKSEL